MKNLHKRNIKIKLANIKYIKLLAARDIKFYFQDHQK